MPHHQSFCHGLLGCPKCAYKSIKCPVFKPHLKMPDPTSPSPIRSTTCRGLIPDSQQVSSHTSESSDVCLALQGVRTCTDSQDLSRGLSSSLNTKTFTFFRLLRELLVCICCNIHILCIRHKKIIGTHQIKYFHGRPP